MSNSFQCLHIYYLVLSSGCLNQQNAAVLIFPVVHLTIQLESLALLNKALDIYDLLKMQ